MTKQDAIDYYRTQTALANALGITQQTVSEWVDVPALRQIQLERLTGGALVALPTAWEPIARSKAN